MYADTLRSAKVRMAAKLSTRNSMRAKEIRNLKGSWLRMSKLKALGPLLIPGPGDRVYEAHDRHDVRQIMAGNDLLEELHIYGTWSPVVNPIGGIGAIGDYVDGVLATRRFHLSEAIPFRWPDTAAQIRHNLALGQVLEDLLYHPDALLHLADPNPVRGLNIPSLVGDNVEVEILVPAIGIVTAHVVADTGAPQGWPREAHLDSFLLRNLPDVPGAGNEDLITLYEVYEVRPEALFQVFYVLPHPLGHTLREVGLHAPDADVVEHHPRSGYGLEHVLYTLALPESIQDRGERPEFQQQEAYGGDVAHDATKLVQQSTYGIRAGRYLRVQEILDRQAVAVFHGDVVHVVYAICDRDDCRIHAVLRDLLLTTMQVAHYRVATDHGLTVELQDQSQEAVHRRMLRSHIHVQGLEPELVPDGGARQAVARPLLYFLLLGSALFSKHIPTATLRTSVWCLSRSSSITGGGRSDPATYIGV